jgi:hypothetical protein
MHMVQMSFMQIIGMAVMANRRVAAVKPVFMGMVGMVLLGARGHCAPQVIGPCSESEIASSVKANSLFCYIGNLAIKLLRHRRISRVWKPL